MAKFVVTIETDNAAFEDAGREIETARILRDIARRLDKGDDFDTRRLVFDANGNHAGFAQFK